eukprot:3159483-Pyramimonas_sp.AAC.2
MWVWSLRSGGCGWTGSRQRMRVDWRSPASGHTGSASGGEITRVLRTGYPRYCAALCSDVMFLVL